VTDEKKSPAPAPKETKKEAKKEIKKEGSAKGGRLGVALALVLAIVSLLGLGGASYFGWQLNQQQVQSLQELRDLVLKQQRNASGAEALAQTVQVLAEELRLQKQQSKALLSNVDSQHKRLQSLANTSREDWVLAEAEYLLRLANQRLLVERATQGAAALLLSVDAILRDIDYVDLLPVRDALGREMLALKVAGHVDREGLFLRLSALANQLQTLPLIVSATAGEQVAAPLANTSQATGENLSFQASIGRNFWQAVGSFSDYIRITHEEDSVEPILSPEYHFYIKQNARLMVERAQLALMREEQSIFKGSLEQAEFWLNKFYRQNLQKEHLAAELAALQEEVITQDLPDISGSQELLRTYIENMHGVSPAAPTTTEVQ